MQATTCAKRQSTTNRSKQHRAHNSKRIKIDKETTHRMRRKMVRGREEAGVPGQPKPYAWATWNWQLHHHTPQPQSFLSELPATNMSTRTSCCKTSSHAAYLGSNSTLPSSLAEGSVRKEEEEPRLFFELRESRRLCKREKDI
ncbi:unnamed protein product [Polarella glacialis]|uniref:Uncharacterized protein n=1 Tax=Polarella glacialis TaxID=89957 RepID=A0A813GVB3_POLGL|nr:unnamed protein product [Polarella glacialis]